LQAAEVFRLVRRDVHEAVEFKTIMWFDSLASVKDFAGSQYEVAVVPAKVRKLLSDFEDRSAHYETVVASPFSILP
jgi:hypothetical protein